MRIPDISFYDNFIRNNNIKESKIARYTNQISSGKKILAPSDNTIDTIKAQRLRRINQTIEAYNRNMDQVNTVLDVAEGALGNVVEAGMETRTHIIQVLNTGVMDAEDAEVLSDYFTSMRNYVIKQANISVGDTRIFGGVKSQSDPFDDRGYYQGEERETTVPVARGVELNTTFNGKEYLGTVKSGFWDGAGYKIGIVKALDDITKIINDGDLTKLHAYFSETGFHSDIETIGASGTLTINYGGSSFSVSYSNTDTLTDLVNNINSAATNPGVEAFIFVDKDGVYRLGLKGQDTSKKISISDSNPTGLIAKTGNLKAILDEFDESFNKISAYRSKIGTQINVIEDLKPQNEFLKTEFSNLISKFEDADYAGTISELEKTKVAYQALLASFNQNKDLSLLNFLK